MKVSNPHFRPTSTSIQTYCIVYIFFFSFLFLFLATVFDGEIKLGYMYKPLVDSLKNLANFTSTTTLLVYTLYFSQPTLLKTLYRTQNTELR